MIQFAPEFIERNRMLILSECKTHISVGCMRNADSQNKQRMQALLAAMFPEKKITFTEMVDSELLLKAAGSGVQNKNPGLRTARIGIDIGKIEAGAPAITLLNSILLEAKELGASDIHLERSEERTSMRMRIDGVIKPIRAFDCDTGRALAVRIKLLANLNTLETRRPQDGRFSIVAGNSSYDIRVSTVPCTGGESVVLRFLDTMDSDITLGNLGFSAPVLCELEKISRLPHGLVLVTGPTGCGKTTTIAAIAKECDPSTLKIVSIEDPVEYRIPGVIQIQTNEQTGLDFSAILRRILRQDPDIILIGEIRDTETASLAIRAALTGHLVLSTLHTNSALEAKTRLQDLGVPLYILESVLRTVIAQRLVRKTDPVYGYSGRLPVVEVLRQTKSRKHMIVRSFTTEIDALLHQGITTTEEIRRVFGENL